MSTVSVMKREVTVSEVATFELDLTLLKSADLKLAKAIIEAIKSTDKWFFEQPRFFVGWYSKKDCPK